VGRSNRIGQGIVSNEMYQMSRPGVAAAVDNRAAQKLHEAIPHVSLMVSIRRGDLETAIEKGREAIAEL